MRARARELLRRSTPALAKVLVSDFGLQAVVSATGVLVAGLAVMVMTALLIAGRLGWGIAGVVLALEGSLLWRVKAFDILGQMECARGIIYSNLSRVREAHACFLRALRLLRKRVQAYEGLYLLAETNQAMSALAQLIRKHEPRPSAPVAALVGRCLRACDDPVAARTYFETTIRNKAKVPGESSRLPL